MRFIRPIAEHYTLKIGLPPFKKEKSGHPTAKGWNLERGKPSFHKMFAFLVKIWGFMLV